MAVMQTERGIFLFHFLSFVLVSIITTILGILIKCDSLLSTELAVLSMHGIYSLSFLEFWALAEGGFSLQVLELAPIETTHENKELFSLMQLGDSKFATRLQSISNLGLVQQKQNTLMLTPRGRLVTKVLVFVSKIANIRDYG